MNISYNAGIDEKWQKFWQENHTYKFNKEKTDKKYYLLEMFSYPSGASLHLGHWWNYGLSDSFGRFKRMKGFEVFQPMGFDAFGLPAENYAIKTGIHPSDSTMKNIKTMEEQLKKIGATYDWDYEIKTCTPDYYKWSQWLFLKLYESGLAYQKFAPVNWCESCKTVLANEQVINGKCERCNHDVVKKQLTQWFFKITDYADRLLEGHDNIDWPEKTIALQKHWIEKSIGGEIALKIENSNDEIRCFTTRADTLFGVTFIVIAPEHPMLNRVTKKEFETSVNEYIYSASKKTDIERQSSTNEKTGVFTGTYVINPINNEKVPVFVGDYVIGSYGTGAVIGVAAHDERDFDFAKKFNLPVKRVIKSINLSEDKLPFTEKGILVNSSEFDGMESDLATQKILTKLEQMNSGNKKINYKLRDWSVSRQRYWGCPIPIIHCEHCGAVPVPEKDLPVLLPYNVDYRPKGISPLASNPEFVNVTCPKCGRPAKRDCDTLDAFICSSWYFLRYPCANEKDKPFDSDFVNKMLPVDKYVGGIEHACGHLLYSRFITKFLHDKGYINFDEPFKSLVHQGLILGSDGVKMSKSRGNTVNADELVKKYGSDVLRLYLMFGFNYLEGGPWNTEGIPAISKFVERLTRLIEKIIDLKIENSYRYGKEEKEVDYVINFAIKQISKDMEVFSFNTCVARIMEIVNSLYKYDALEIKNTKFMKDSVFTLVKLLAPMAPHLSEEYYSYLDVPNKLKSIFNENYPTFDEAKLILDEVEIAVQINNKIILRLNLPTVAQEEEIKSIILNNEKIKNSLSGKEIKNVIIIKGRLVNIIAK